MSLTSLVTWTAGLASFLWKWLSLLADDASHHKSPGAPASLGLFLKRTLPSPPLPPNSVQGP